MADTGTGLLLGLMNFLELVVVVKFGDILKMTEFYFKRVNFMISELYLKKMHQHTRTREEH